MIVDGQIIGERYRVEHLIGSGRFASVYSATDTWNSKAVALKVFLPSTDRRTVVGERFFRRTKSAMSSPHPVIVPIKDSGRTPEGVPFLVMELVEGPTIEQAVESQGALPIAKSLHIAKVMLESLAAAHSEGYVHRNINPANVALISPDSTQPGVRILDFGVAQDLVDYLAIAPSAIGSTRYLAPELFLDTDRAWTPAVDVFAVGMVIFQMLTGRLPFDKEVYVGSDKNTINAYASIFNLPGPKKFAPNVPLSVDEVVQKALSIEQWERYKNAQEMLDAFESALSKVDLSRLDTAQSAPQYQHVTRDQWHKEVDQDDEMTTPGNISAAVHAYADQQVVDAHHPEPGVVQSQAGGDIHDAVHSYAELFSPNSPPFPDLDFSTQYDATKKTTLPEADEEATEASFQPPPRRDGYRGAPTINMGDPPAFDVPRILSNSGDTEVSDDSENETLDQPLDERSRLLLDQDGGIETPLRVLEKLYASGANIDETIVDTGIEEDFESPSVGSNHPSTMDDEDTDDEDFETQPFQSQPKRRAVKAFPAELQHYNATEEPSYDDSSQPEAPLPASIPSSNGSPAPSEIPIPTGRHIIERGRNHRLSSADVGAHFPDLKRRKIVRRFLMVAGIAFVVGVLVLLALFGLSNAS